MFQFHLQWSGIFIFIAQKVLYFAYGWEFSNSYYHHLSLSRKNSASW